MVMGPGHQRRVLTTHRVPHADTRLGLVLAPRTVLGTKMSPVFGSPSSVSNGSRRDMGERRYRGRAPAVDLFTGEKPEIRFKD